MLLVAFVVVERMTREPLLPLRVVLDRNRGGVYLAVGLSVIGMFGLFLFLTYYLQIVKGYSPVESGLAFLPMIAGMITGSTQIGARLMNRVAAAAADGARSARGRLRRRDAHPAPGGQFLRETVLPAQILLGLGMGRRSCPR